MLRPPCLLAANATFGPPDEDVMQALIPAALPRSPRPATPAP